MPPLATDRQRHPRRHRRASPRPPMSPPRCSAALDEARAKRGKSEDLNKSIFPRRRKEFHARFSGAHFGRVAWVPALRGHDAGETHGPRALIGNLRQYTGGVTELDWRPPPCASCSRGSARSSRARSRTWRKVPPSPSTGRSTRTLLFQPIGPDSDVHILPQIAGG